MTEEIKAIASRIKELREIQGVSAETVARELRMPIEQYLLYETGEVDIPVSFLYQIAHRFNVELSVLLSGENPKLHIFCVVRQGKGLSVERRKQYKYESLAYNFVNKKAEPFLVTVEPTDSKDIHFNAHPGQEFNYVLEGRMKVIIDTHEIILNEGDALYFDSGYNHAMQALDKKPAKFIAIVL